MSDWLDAFAEHVATLHPDLTYQVDAPYADDAYGVITGPMPTTPQRVVGVVAYGGAEADARLGWDEPTVQLRVRGTADERVSRRVAQALYDGLHGAGPFELGDGTRVQLIVGQQSGPITLGLDASGNHEHTVNVRVELRRVTTHRQ